MTVHATVHVTGNDVSIVWAGNGKTLHLNINTDYQRISWAVIDPEAGDGPLCVKMGNFPPDLATDLLGLDIAATPVPPQNDEDDDEHFDPGNEDPVRH